MERGEQALKSEKLLADVARDTRRKVSFLLRKPFVDQAEVYTIAKEFFRAYLKKEYEFTAEELKRELHKVYLSTVVREKVEALVEKLSLMEYTDTQYSQTEVKYLLEDLETIVKMLVSEHKRQLPFLTRVANWLFRKQPTQRTTYISEYPVIEQNDPATIELNILLEEVYAALEKNSPHKAAKIYKTLLKKYDGYGTTIRQEFYHKVHEAYEAILQQQEHP